MLRSSLSALRALPVTLARLRGRPARKRPIRRKPLLETLEDRMAPAVFSPSPATPDNNEGSLRTELIDAQDNGQDNVFNLQAGTYLLTFTQPGQRGGGGVVGGLAVTRAGHTFTFQGAGPDQTIIDAGQIDRVFEIYPNATAIFRNLTLQGGLAEDGGSSGTAAGPTDALGGGILNNGGHVTLDNVHIYNCAARAGAGGLAAGGGVYSSGGSLTEINSTFQADSAYGGAGTAGTSATPAGGKGGDAQGGGLYALGTSISLVNDGFFRDTAGGGAGGTGKSQPGFAADGGAGGAGGNGQGGGFYTAVGTVAIADTTFEGDSAGGSLGGQGGDGTPGGDVNIPGGYGGAGGAAGAGQGGGLYVASGTVNVVRSTLDGNAANGGPGGGGGQGGSSQLQGGYGGNGGLGGAGQGGGVFAAGGVVNLSNATLSGNTTAAGTGGPGGPFGQGINNGAPGSDGLGGAGGASQGGGLFAGPGATNVHNSTVAFNKSTGALGGTGRQPGATSVGQGGGVATAAAATFQAVSSIFADNAVTGATATDIDVSGRFALADHILLGTNAGSGVLAGNPSFSGNLVGTTASPIDPKLGPLADNGGPTQTHALLPGSPAIDKGSNPDGLTTDQRGYFTRSVGGAADIGAFEVGASPTPPPVQPVQPMPTPAPKVVEAVTARFIKVHRKRQLGVFDAAGRLKFVLHPSGKAFRGNYQVETRDVNGDGVMDVILRAVVRAGRKRKTLTEVFSGRDGSALPATLA